jgi:hypothetical protein
VLNGKLWHLKFVYGVDTLALQIDIPIKPYFLAGNMAFHAWKIYTDSFSCFQATVLPTERRYRWVKQPTGVGGKKC